MCKEVSSYTPQPTSKLRHAAFHVTLMRMFGLVSNYEIRTIYTIGCVYRSPNSDTRNNVELMKNLKNICERNQFTHVLICGDFNSIVECLRDCFLTRHVMQPTHKRGDQQANILDLILTNEDTMIEDLRYEAPLGKSHHCSLVFKFRRCYAEYKSSNVKTFKYAKGDYKKLRALVRECDLSVLEDMPMEEG